MFLFSFCPNECLPKGWEQQPISKYEKHFLFWWYTACASLPFTNRTRWKRANCQTQMRNQTIAMHVLLAGNFCTYVANTLYSKLYFAHLISPPRNKTGQQQLAQLLFLCASWLTTHSFVQSARLSVCQMWVHCCCCCCCCCCCETVYNNWGKAIIQLKKNYTEWFFPKMKTTLSSRSIVSWLTPRHASARRTLNFLIPLSSLRDFGSLS